MVYRKAETLAPPQLIPAVFWNNLCWFGSIWSFPNRPDDYLKVACENATADIKNALYRDSRGVERALRGDAQGAKEDFEFYEKYARENNIEDEAVQRRRWIDRLNKMQERAFTNPDEPLRKEFKILRSQQ